MIYKHLGYKLGCAVKINFRQITFKNALKTLASRFYFFYRKIYYYICESKSIIKDRLRQKKLVL